MMPLLRNPITQWLAWLVRKFLLERRYVKQGLEIGYMATATRTRFGFYNKIYAGAVLTDVCIGDMSYVGERCRLSKVTIGKYSCIGPEVLAGLGMHPSRGFVSIHPAFFSPHLRAGRTFASGEQFKEHSPIHIGHDVWIGARAIILDGVSIGDGAIIGAGAVVTKDVPPYTVACGVPAKVVRQRFPQEEIERLLQLKWWDLDLDALQALQPSFCDVEKLVSTSSVTKGGQ